ncbi:MAG: tetratricopeptide (TPR) repeat protein [Gammaproteobacteria bacterium]|jgi:tetratricopeptide (TPR) repeat protein
MKSFFIFISIILLSNSTLAVELEDFGTISFPTSASGEAQAHFLRGVAILHSFGWKQAREEFQLAQKADPDFALAYWGDSLTYNHPLIAEWDRETPKQVLKRLGSTKETRLAKAPTEREKGFISAVEALFFGPGDSVERRGAYMKVMRSLYQRYPNDDEVTAHYVLSLLMSAGSADEGHRQNILAGAIAMDLSRRNPKHPGAVHYTIHAFDDPIHAPIALSAALIFDDIAPAVSHARHMPTHIFIQHGMWQQVSDSNQDAYNVAVKLWEPGDKAGDMTHALDWGQYGDLQLGDYKRAALWIRRMEGIIKKNPGQHMIMEALPRIKARMIVETEQWQTELVTDESYDTELLATGLSAVHLGKFDLAQKAADKLAAKAMALGNSDDRSYYAATAKPLQVMHRSVAGMLSIARGQIDAGLAMLAEGVEIAESMRPPNGAPKPIKPVHELYGEALMAANKPAEAVEQFTTSLLRTPNRPLSLIGLARTYATQGDVTSARENYQKLNTLWKNRKFPAAVEARRYLESTKAN